MPTYPADDATGPIGSPLRPGPGAEPDERPLDDCLADYWQGAFTLRDTPEEPAAAPAHAGLGPSGISVRGRDLATLLDRAYRAFTS